MHVQPSVLRRVQHRIMYTDTTRRSCINDVMNKSFLLFMVKRGDQKLMKKSCCHPFKKKGLVGQKKLRRREPEEGSNRRKLRRINFVNRCSRCHQLDHNLRTCKIPPPRPQTDKCGWFSTTNFSRYLSKSSWC